MVAPNDLRINEAGANKRLELLLGVHVQNPMTRSVSSGRQVIAYQNFSARSKERDDLSVEALSVALMSQLVHCLERHDEVDVRTDQAWPGIGLEVRTQEVGSILVAGEASPTLFEHRP